MPVLNPHPAFFPQAVRSILDQTDADFELLIVEDPSPSSAAEMLKNFPDPRIRHIANPERTSLVRQLNQGLAAAQHEWVARMDADDIAHPDRLQKQLAFLRDHPDIDVLGSQLDIIDTDGVKVGCRRYPLEQDAILRTMPIYNPLAHPSVIFRRSLILQVGGYLDEGRPEDYDLWSRLAKHGARFANYPEALIDYRTHPAAFKHERLRATLRGTLDVKKKYWLNEMGLRGRLRMLGERGLMLLPSWLVLKLFVTLYYKRS